jgi:hypothetical protein
MPEKKTSEARTVKKTSSNTKTVTKKTQVKPSSVKKSITPKTKGSVSSSKKTKTQTGNKNGGLRSSAMKTGKDLIIVESP